MKRFHFFLFIAVMCLALSCSKNSDSNDDDRVVTVDKRENLLASGDSGADILSNTNYDRLLIEIGFVTGFRPTTAAMTEFIDFLRARTFKEDIEILYTELDSPAEDDLTLEEIARLESENRTAYTSDGTLAIYIYFADAPAEGDDLEEGLVTLGAVYRNTSMIIHEATIRELASRSFRISDADVESATLNHEFGHLFGLVNLGTDMVNDHESQSENENGELEGDKHCNVAGCLMRAELQFGGPTGKSSKADVKSLYANGMDAGCIVSGNSILSLLNSTTARGSAAVDLDTQCILDLRANGGR